LVSDGSLWSWGWNSYWLGRNGDIAASVPAQIGSDTDWDFVATTGYLNFAVKRNGTLWAWGNNDTFNNTVQGILGVPDLNGVWDPLVATPRRVGNDSDWDKVFIDAGHKRVYGRKKNGTLWAWGENGWNDSERGALGVGSTDDTVVVPTKMIFE
jgi:alpha-tubulin suppressor-like RCC1 family protein